MKRFVILFLAVLLPTLIIGCNTIQGIGEDVSAGGRVLADTADKAKNVLNR